MTDVDARIILALADLGASVHVPEHSLWPRVRAELGPHDDAVRRSPWKVRAAVLAAAAVVAVGLVVSIAPARRAVANLFGIGSTTIERVDRLRDAPRQRAVLEGGADVRELRVDLARLGLGLPASKLVGPPMAWSVDPDGETVVAFRHVVLGQRRGRDVPAAKRVLPSARVEPTNVDGEPAMWIEGPHTRTVQGRAYRSSSALVWTARGTELRLEGDLDLPSMRRVAASVEPVRA